MGSGYCHQGRAPRMVRRCILRCIVGRRKERRAEVNNLVIDLNEGNPFRTISGEVIKSRITTI